MNIEMLRIEEIKPYEKNPRRNDYAVEKVAKSIEEFGFKVPIILDENKIIITGHTRYKAAIKLGYKEVPCIIAKDLSKKQVKAFRIADNKVAEEAKWDFELLYDELKGIEDYFTGFGQEEQKIDWAGVVDLDETTYEKPEKEMLKCPNCSHVDSKTHFIKVELDENIS